MIDTVKWRSKMNFNYVIHSITMIGGFGMFGASLAGITGLIIGLILGTLFIIVEK